METITIYQEYEINYSNFQGFMIEINSQNLFEIIAVKEFCYDDIYFMKNGMGKENLMTEAR